jgi:Putative beta-barrel porin-2, OmpL-like. bbp2
MKLTKFSVTAFLGALAMCGGSALAQAPIVKAGEAFSSRNTSLKREYAAVIPTAYSCGDEPVSGCCDAEPSCDGCGCDGLGGAGGDDPWKLIPDPIAGISFGGWTSVGYHSQGNPNSFNTLPENLQLGQQWFWAERVADGSKGFDIGGRIDYLYGTDAPDTQAFGTTAPHFDAGWDNTSIAAGALGSGYGHAMPQLYGEVAMGDLSVKMGRFFTIVGNEVVGATGNFFYSRQFMFWNAEPFTHTGALSTYKVSDDTQLFNGYVMGWDSGFQDNGDAYLGGFKHKLNDTWSVIYSSCVGRFNDGNTVTNGENGWIHSVIFTGGLTDDLTYISQWDAMQTENVVGARVRNTVGTNQYLILKLTDKLSLGQRFEWFNGAAPIAGVSGDLYNYTVGLNYAYNKNLLFRPEIRQVWDKSVSPIGHVFNEAGRASQLAAGGDMVFVF